MIANESDRGEGRASDFRLQPGHHRAVLIAESNTEHADCYFVIAPEGFDKKVTIECIPADTSLYQLLVFCSLVLAWG